MRSHRFQNVGKNVKMVLTSEGYRQYGADLTTRRDDIWHFLNLHTPQTRSANSGIEDLSTTAYSQTNNGDRIPALTEKFNFLPWPRVAEYNRASYSQPLPSHILAFEFGLILDAELVTKWSHRGLDLSAMFHDWWKHVVMHRGNYHLHMTHPIRSARIKLFFGC
ncbi:hypothetical protein M427DRAFT_156895 [Gonapodya prolifera JEL478]|uniref:Uncharacterized protein n=1 Tax=Gonapodya prolifera (strain JEL478) TaxID=1344416 RepID=A0A139A8K0_GONPJ|nr:hypothetical protein M427DRAFT_156895 [Gonapodya prolifera JEL478]|eukprot:KXS13029.1 hypothetical protein M427DRAFT_156895 [Gonapodya prolifera JEL478]